jgi:sugar/nucleoside kinase (ribokinase family)
MLHAGAALVRCHGIIQTLTIHENHRDNDLESGDRQEFKCCACRGRAKAVLQPPRFEPGGGGVNVSRAIKKLGGESMLLYPAGGLTGERLQELLDQEGLDHRPFPIEGLIRESLVILEESTGRQYRFGMPGPEFQNKNGNNFFRNCRPWNLTGLSGGQRKPSAGRAH